MTSYGSSGGSEEGWKKNADTHKMSTEEVKKAGLEGSMRPPGKHPGEVLHQRRRLPMSYTTITMAGLAITFAVGYVVLYANKATGADVAKVASTARPEDTRPRK